MTTQRVSVLTAEKILRAEGTAQAIADKHLVSVPTVRLYKKLKTKTARAAAVNLKKKGLKVKRLKAKKRHQLTPEQVKDIRESTHISSKNMAGVYGCSASLIRMIRANRAYKES